MRNGFIAGHPNSKSLLIVKELKMSLKKNPEVQALMETAADKAKAAAYKEAVKAAKSAEVPDDDDKSLVKGFKAGVKAAAEAVKALAA